MRPGVKSLIVLSSTAFVADFIYILARSGVTTSASVGADPFHGLFVFAGFGTAGAALYRLHQWGALNPVRLIARIVMTAIGFLVLLGLLHVSAMVGFHAENGALRPWNPFSLIVSTLIAVAGGLAAIRIILALSELIFVKRRRNTRRNYVLLLSAAAAFALSNYFFNPMALGNGVLDWLPVLSFIVLLSLMLLNSFRFSWILVLTRREKMINLLLAFFGFIFFLILTIDAAVIVDSPTDGGFLQRALTFYHPVAQTFVSSVFLFGCLYMGIGSVSTLLHLPTAKEFDRKKMELSSLHNLGRLVTQVFDFDELVATTTHLALEVSEGEAAWLELLPEKEEGEGGNVRTEILVHSLRNVSDREVRALRFDGGVAMQDLVISSGKQIIVQDAANDRRVRGSGLPPRFGSLALLPLNGHDRVVGVLGIAKQHPFEFDADALNVLTAFADMVSIALENSRLIGESIQRERFNQELKVAQQMQHSLLPALLPLADTYEISAVSLPAFEVGGDYYDVIQLDEDHLGLTIGDVSGKGVSAALYMAQVKGMFHTLCRDSLTTRQLLEIMNDILGKTLDRKSFISLLYAVLDVRTGRLVFSRAGHCPLLYISAGSSRYLRPGGIGLGLERRGRFADSIEEESLELQPDDLIVLYTDGVTEAKNEQGEEFHTERLADIVLQHRHQPTDAIMHTIIQEVKQHAQAREAEDDRTLLVLRWKGVGTPPSADDENTGGGS